MELKTSHNVGLARCRASGSSRSADALQRPGARSSGGPRHQAGATADGPDARAGAGRSRLVETRPQRWQSGLVRICVECYSLLYSFFFSAIVMVIKLASSFSINNVIVAI